jgi:hypothetical protein
MGDFGGARGGGKVMNPNDNEGANNKENLTE